MSRADMWTATLCAIFLALVFNAGQWWAERSIRLAEAEELRGRVSITMPANPEDAASMLALLSLLLEQAEVERAAKAAKRGTQL